MSLKFLYRIIMGEWIVNEKGLSFLNFLFLCSFPVKAMILYDDVQNVNKILSVQYLIMSFRWLICKRIGIKFCMQRKDQKSTII